MYVDKKSAPRGCYAKICYWREDFKAVSGYDDSMHGYGFEDFDLRNRLDLLGGEGHFTSHNEYLKTMTHDGAVCLEGEKNSLNAYKTYENYIDYNRAGLFYLLATEGFDPKWLYKLQVYW